MTNTLLTTRGTISAHDVRIGEPVFEWNTGNVINISTLDIKSGYGYLMTLSDGRSTVYGEHDLIQVGRDLLYIKDISGNHDLKNIVIAPEPMKMLPNLMPSNNHDAYAAGAFIINGNMDVDNINLPYGQTNMDDYLLYKYGMSSDVINTDDMQFYSYSNSNDDDCITWEQIFTEYNPMSRVIPIKYMFASIKDRWQFIAGAFDTGCIDETNKDLPFAIFNTMKEPLLQLQLMLISIGITSMVDEVANPISNRKYFLKITSQASHHNSIFHNTHSILELMFHRNIYVNSIKDYKLTVTNIQRTREHIQYFKYTTDNKYDKICNGKFMPVISQ